MRKLLYIILYKCNIRLYISSKDAFLFSLDNPVFQFQIYIILLYHSYIVDEETVAYCISLQQSFNHLFVATKYINTFPSKGE